ncbi:MAG: CHAP domain-containing protein [Sporichthyaceae bacterium]
MGVIGTCWGRVSRRRGVVVLAGALLLTAPLATADAGSQTLCRGYAKCRDAGYSDAGYQTNSRTSYWRMFTGPNCTNYVAYRLVRDGLADDRPAPDPGQSNASLNAFAWGVTYGSLTNSVPKVGSVAWWGANAGKGSIGHVAYVEKVNRDGSIAISEDSSSGNGFAWKKLTPGQGWPQGFIHFGADRPRALPMPPSGSPERPERPERIPGGKFGGEWTGGGVQWIEGEESTVPDRVEATPERRRERPAYGPKRSVKKAHGKAAKRRAPSKEMGGEVGGALSGMGGWQGSYGPANR